MASSELKEIRRIRRTLVALDLRELEHAIRQKGGEIVDTAEVEAVRGVREEQLELLGKYESRYLIRKAESWGIEVPHKREWYQAELYVLGAEDDPILVPQESLNNLGKTVITKRIRDARFAYWKGWVDLLIPILALIVAALALFKDIIVEVLKNKL